MSFRDWMYCLAIGGVLVASLASEGQTQSNSYPVEHDRQPQSNSAPSYTEPNCPKATSAEEANFCVQRRAAEAAEQQVIWGREQAISAREQALWGQAQFWLGVVGLLALIATLIFTAKAAAAAKSAAESGIGMLKHAADAAKAAQDSVAEARKATKFAQATADAAESSIHNDRAWLTLGHNNFYQHHENGKLVAYVFLIRWENTGRTPAINCKGSVEFDARPPTTDDTQYTFTGTQTYYQCANPGPGMATGIRRRIEMEEFHGLKRGEKKLFLYSRVTYNDIYTAELRHSEACLAIAINGDYALKVKGKVGDVFSLGVVGTQHSVS